MNITHLESASLKVMPKLWLVIPLVCALGAAIAPAHASPTSAMLVDAGTIVPGLVANIRYAGSHNFVGRPINGYRARRCLLTQPAANALAEVARDLAARGLVIKGFDCYRPTRAVADLVRATREPRRPRQNLPHPSTSARCFGIVISHRTPAIHAARRPLSHWRAQTAPS